MKIKTIKPYKKAYMKVLFTNETSLVLHRDTVVKFGLFSTDAVNEQTLKTIKEQDRYPSLMQKALDALAKEEQAYEQLKKMLLSDGDITLVQAVMDHLEQLGYIDDVKALERQINEVIEFKFEGPYHLKDRLKHQGFDAYDIDQVLSRYTDEIQQAKIETWLNQTLKTVKEPKAKIARKLRQKLYQKGFDLDKYGYLIDTALNDVEVDETTLLKKRISALQSKYDVQIISEKQKLIQKLMREGFPYDLIKTHLQ